MIFKLFGLEKSLGFIIVWLIGSIFYLLGAELIRQFNNGLVKSINVIFSTWMGIAFTFLWMFGFYELVNLIVPLNFAIAGFFVIIIVLVLVFYSLYNASTFSVRTIRVESEKLKKPLKVVQLTDLHIGSTHRQDFLAKTVERVNELDPDFVVITGDLIDGMHHYKDDEFLCLNNVHAPMFFVLGNHEQFIDISRVYDLLERTHIKFLRNVAIVHEGIQIIGVDDTSSKEVFLRNLKSVAIDTNKFTMLLYHRPNMFNEVAKEDVDLMLSGHTHAGQLFPINLLLAINDGPVRGLHKKNNTVLYVSNGTGWWGPPMRLGSRNEITVIELIPKYIDHPDYPLLENKHQFSEEKKNSVFKNKHLIENAEIISLKRGNQALVEDKHEKILFDVEKLLSKQILENQIMNSKLLKKSLRKVINKKTRKQHLKKTRNTIIVSRKNFGKNSARKKINPKSTIKKTKHSKRK